jgi:hypothetical protein
MGCYQGLAGRLPAGKGLQEHAYAVKGLQEHAKIVEGLQEHDLQLRACTSMKHRSTAADAARICPHAVCIHGMTVGLQQCCAAEGM